MSEIPFFARRFVAGTTLEEAIPVVRDLNSSRIFASLDILGENVASKLEATEAVNNYVKVIESIHQQHLQCNISIKLTMLGLDLSEDLADENLRTLLRVAEKHSTLVRIDMEGSPYTERTVNLFLRVRKDFANVGIVIQAYLHRSVEDLERIIQVKGKVRLCKGAYKERSTIAWQNMNEIRENYLHLAKLLLSAGNYPAFATHDDILLREVRSLAADLKVEKAEFEFQMLYGLRRQTWFDLVKSGHNMRVYIPYGKHWLPYFSRRLRERKENVMFVLSNLFKK